MTDERFENWLREHAQDYNRPPTADVEQMWHSIEQQHFDVKPIEHRWWTNSWLRVAAALVIGAGLGRASITSSVSAPRPAVGTTAVNTASPAEGSQVMSDPATLRYIGQTVALLASFEGDVPVVRGDTALKTRAKDLLLTTRLLLDSRNTADPIVHTLLEDLELVLVQIVQMPPKRNASDVDLIKEAMEQREVMPRLIAAVANNTSAE